jgi:hypothetical protein
VTYANSIPFCVWKSSPGKYLKQDFETHGYIYEKLNEYWAIMVPSNFKPVIPKEKIMLMSGSMSNMFSLKILPYSGRLGTNPGGSLPLRSFRQNFL